MTLARLALAVAVPVLPHGPGAHAPATPPAPPGLASLVQQAIAALPAPVQSAVTTTVNAVPQPVSQTVTPVVVPPSAPPAPAPVAGPSGGSTPTTTVAGGAPVAESSTEPQPGGLSVLRASSPVLLLAPAAAVTAPAPPAVGGVLPDIQLPVGPEGQRVAVALFLLPLLFATWVFLAVRVSRFAVARRGAGQAGTLAEQLGVEPAELVGVSERTISRLREHVVFDDLTGVARRAAGMAALEREVARARRSGQPLCALFIDLDGLKATNDTLGHEAGDRLIRRMAGVLTERTRESDVVFRFGGDEFVVVLPGTDATAGSSFVSEIRTRAAAEEVAFSAGIAELDAADTAGSLLDRADQRLYAEKRKRSVNRVSAPAARGAAGTAPSRSRKRPIAN